MLTSTSTLTAPSYGPSPPYSRPPKSNLNSPLFEYRFVVTIDYRDLSNRNQPRTTLFLRNTGRQHWAVEAVRIDPPL